jgi:hypothetical protein
MAGFVNVRTDYRARATTVRFSSRETEAPFCGTKKGCLCRPFLLNARRRRD